MEKPIAESCLRNQQAIYETLSPYLKDKSLSVFEIGSGTGQHAVYLADRLPNVSWQPSDVEACIDGISQWALDAEHGNVQSPIVLDVNAGEQLETQYDVVFTANTIHFVSESTAENVIKCAAKRLEVGGRFFVYGPFKDGGQYTSEGDARLDMWLKGRDPESGIKDRLWVMARANNSGMLLKAEHAMPANNFILVFEKERGEA